MVERLVANEKVVGSSPIARSILVISPVQTMSGAFLRGSREKMPLFAAAPNEIMKTIRGGATLPAFRPRAKDFFQGSAAHSFVMRKGTEWTRIP